MNHIRIEKKRLVDFCTEAFKACGVDQEDAVICSEVLVEADIRGIPSHGVARLKRYLSGLKEGLMLTGGSYRVMKESPVSILVDAEGGLGAPVSYKIMSQILDKAETSGMAFGLVSNSNHYGIAGYYAMMALERDMIGISMTNTAALGVPTYARQVMFGTNPLAFAAPADRERAFVLDMSTTVVTRGKIDVYNRESKDLESGWAVDKNGRTSTDAESLLQDMFYRRGGGIVPLGGESEQLGGHKGFGLAVMVDIMTGVLSGSNFGAHIYDEGESSARVSHCFGAMKIDLFMDPLLFRKNMDQMLSELRTMDPREGQKQVYFAGLKEFLAEENSLTKGVPLSTQVWDDLKKIALEYNLEFSF
jgi:L-2-hydroxycarboxylate dehydrogenase (NAD+)